LSKHDSAPFNEPSVKTLKVLRHAVGSEAAAPHAFSFATSLLQKSVVVPVAAIDADAWLPHDANVSHDALFKQLSYACR
jgi:hypothetical protein